MKKSADRAQKTNLTDEVFAAAEAHRKRPGIACHLCQLPVAWQEAVEEARRRGAHVDGIIAVLAEKGLGKFSKNMIANHISMSHWDYRTQRNES